LNRPRGGWFNLEYPAAHSCIGGALLRHHDSTGQVTFTFDSTVAGAEPGKQGAAWLTQQCLRVRHGAPCRHRFARSQIPCAAPF
jgi:hypothetical protein